MLAIPNLRFEGWAIPFALAAFFGLIGAVVAFERPPFNPAIPGIAIAFGFVLGLPIMLLNKPRQRHARIVDDRIHYDSAETPLLSRLFPILGVVAFWAPIFGLVWSIQGYRANRYRGGWALWCSRIGIGLGIVVNIIFAIFVANKELGGGK